MVNAADVTSAWPTNTDDAELYESSKEREHFGTKSSRVPRSINFESGKEAKSDIALGLSMKITMDQIAAQQMTTDSFIKQRKGTIET